MIDSEQVAILCVALQRWSDSLRQAYDEIDQGDDEAASDRLEELLVDGRHVVAGLHS